MKALVLHNNLEEPNMRETRLQQILCSGDENIHIGFDLYKLKHNFFFFFLLLQGMYYEAILIERQVSSSALITFLVEWCVNAVSLLPGDTIFAQLACPFNDIIFCLHQE